jgi:hypothetical protein
MAEVSSSSHRVTRVLGILIQFLTTLVLIGILIVLALLYIEIKKMNGNDYFLNINPVEIKGQVVSTLNGHGTSSMNPIYMQAVQ